MKLFKTTLAAVLLAAACASFAQATAAPQAAHVMHQPGDRIIKILNLDAVRAEQVRVIIGDERTQAKALWEANKGSADREAKHAQMKAVHEATKAKLATVLTPAELTQLKEVMMKHRHHGFGPKPS